MDDTASFACNGSSQRVRGIDVSTCVGMDFRVLLLPGLRSGIDVAPPASNLSFSFRASSQRVRGIDVSNCVNGSDLSSMQRGIKVSPAPLVISSHRGIKVSNCVEGIDFRDSVRPGSFITDVLLGIDASPDHSNISEGDRVHDVWVDTVRDFSSGGIVISVCAQLSVALPVHTPCSRTSLFPDARLDAIFFPDATTSFFSDDETAGEFIIPGEKDCHDLLWSDRCKSD